MVLREAIPQDRDGILKIATHTWEGWDYVPLFIDTWLAEKGLFVAEAGKKIVGITKTTELSKGELWFEAIRVAEEERGKGLGMEIAKRQLEMALATHPRSIRLSTADRNKASISISKSLGFVERVLFQFYEDYGSPGVPLREDLNIVTLRGEQMIKKAWCIIQESEEYHLSKKLLPHTWEFYDFTEELFSRLAQEGFVFSTEDTGGVLVLLKNRYSSLNYEVAFLEGSEESVSELSVFAQRRFEQKASDDYMDAFAVSERKKGILERFGMKRSKDIEKVIVFEYPLPAFR
ncbi:GNAT family N-acetyltransferase [bacterium]|nr:GNAT family N-acetyltransferase [bacterium]